MLFGYPAIKRLVSSASPFCILDMRFVRCLHHDPHLVMTPMNGMYVGNRLTYAISLAVEWEKGPAPAVWAEFRTGPRAWSDI